MTSEVTLALGAALLLTVGAYVVLWAKLERTRKGARQSLDTWKARADAGPVGLIWQDAGDAGASNQARHLLGRPALDGPAEIGAALAHEDRTALAQALDRLGTRGEPFEMTVRTDGAGRPLRLWGGVEDGATLVWVADDKKYAALSDAYSAREDEVATLTGVLQMLPLPVWWRRAEGLEIAGCNKAYAQALDSDPAVVTDEQRELGAGYIAAGGQGLAERAARTRLAQSESHHVVLGGERRLLDFTEIPIDGTDGAVGGYAVDVTALEEVQAELANHIAAHGDVLQKLGTAISIYGPDKRLKFYNTAFVRLWGIDDDALEGEPTLGEILELLRERRRLPEIVDFPAYKRAQDQRFTSLIEPYEELMHLPDESTLRMVVSPHPFGGLLMVYEDATDRLALERSYNTLIDVQQETLDNLHEGLAVFGSDGRLKLFNPRYGHMWDLPKTFLSGEPHITEVLDRTKDFFPQDGDWDSLKQKIIMRVTDPTSDSGQLELTNGTILDYASVPLPNGECLLTYLDVSDRVQVNRALVERNLALEKADKLKSQFIANVSYELRTPLNAIIGFTEVLDTELPGKLTVKQKDYVGSIIKASHNLMALINDILDLATIEAGFMNLQIEPVDLHGLLKSLIDVTEERAQEAKLDIGFDCPAEIGKVNCDGTRVKQAVFNVLSNAIKFTPPGGSVTLEARRHKGSIAITVRDTGIGIEQENQERVMEKFERGDPNARESAAGLGLALTKSLIEPHGGSVALESEPGEGTAVTCVLPAQMQVLPAGETATPDAAE